MGEILNKYFASVFTEEKDMEDRERGKINSDILKNVHVTATGEVLEARSLADMVPLLIDEGRVVKVIYMDFSKVFNKVPHGRLVSKV
eukprot:g42140.t1